MSARVLLSLVFLTFMGGAGAWLPFITLGLERQGIAPWVIAAVMALMPVTRLVATPLWAFAADHTRSGTRVLQAVSVGTAATVVALAVAPSSAWLVALGLGCFSIMRAPAGPLLDAAVLTTLEAEDAVEDYGRIRLWGSVGFVVAVLVASQLAETSDRGPIILGAAMWSVTAVLTFLLPAGDGRGPAAIGPALTALRHQPGALWFFGACALHGMGLNAYDAWITVHIESLGLATRWSGVCIAGGVLVEIAVLASGRQLLAWRGPGSLVVLAMAVTGVRFAATAWVTQPWALALVCSLHGVSFGVFWVGAVEQVRRWAAPEIRASGQALMVACAYGLGPLCTSAVASVVVGPLGTPALFAVVAVASAVSALAAWRAFR